MKILFAHQNFPAQFKHLAPALKDRGHEVVALTAESNKQQTSIQTYRYTMPDAPPKPGYARLATTYMGITDRAHRIGRAATQLRDKLGFVPDVIFGHTGWGETLFLKEVFPDARLIVYAEFYYATKDLDVGFDPEFTNTDTFAGFPVIARQAHLALAMVQADAALSPTEWQADTFPPEFRSKITITHDGVDTDALQPNPQAHFTLPNGSTLRAGDEVLTYISRNIEPYRGSHIFMRSLPQILAARPNAHVVIIGGDSVSYGTPPAQGTWKERFLSEIAGAPGLERVHFLGRIPYADYVRLMQITRAHAYLTIPFVLSWSLLESMAMGAHVIASRTAPVEEVVVDGVNGQLVDFFDVDAWSEALIAALAHPERFAARRVAARKTIVENYDLKRICLPRLIRFVEGA
jgi:glycosyltransferase involved in cell wall biosynthesis